MQPACAFGFLTGAAGVISNGIESSRRIDSLAVSGGFPKKKTKYPPAATSVKNNIIAAFFMHPSNKAD
jgi:hypothetical protein